MVTLFQSRSGFSGRLDSGGSGGGSSGSSVSIPFWVFWSSRRVDSRNFEALTVFQSRSGFSGRLDRLREYPHKSRQTRFQSRSGFSGRLDDTFVSGVFGTIEVSIPFWVFWSSRPNHVQRLWNSHQVSIPFWVFWSSRRCHRGCWRCRD